MRNTNSWHKLAILTFALLLLAGCNYPDTGAADPGESLLTRLLNGEPETDLDGAPSLTPFQPLDASASPTLEETEPPADEDEQDEPTEAPETTPTPTVVPRTAAECEAMEKEDRFPRFGRLMHDPQWMPWPSRMGAPDWPNGFSDFWYPETVQLTTGPKSGDGRFAYSKEWLQFLRDLQPNDEAAVWIARVAAGLFNRGNEFVPILNLDQLEEEPVAESISSGGNVVYILEERNGSGRIEMIYFRKWPPSVSDLNYQVAPWLVTKFTSISRDGEVGNAGGIDVYFPNLSKSRNGYWVDLKRVELFPKLPYCATARVNLGVYAAPSASSAQIGSVGAGQFLPIVQYMPQGSDVWGRNADGWVLLEYQSNGQPVYTTSWSMQTRPPIDF